MIRFTSRSARSRAALLLPFIGVLFGAPSQSAAQFGGLARRAQGAVEQKVESRIEEELPYTRLPAPDFNDRVLEITESRLERLLRGFDAEAEYADRAGDEYRAQLAAHESALAEYDRNVQAYDERMETYGACVERFTEEEQDARDANDSLVEKAIEDMNDEEFAVYIEELALRGEAIARDVEAGKRDEATMRRQEAYMVEVSAMQVEQSRRIQLALSGVVAEVRRSTTEDARLVAACGPAPEHPALPESRLTGPEGVLAQRGAGAAGLTPEQYAIMRERVLYWAAEEGRPTRMGFSDAEMQALGDEEDSVERAVEGMRDAKVPL